MTDLHSHLLFDFDDGARTREESETILKRSAAQGVTCMVAASHAGAGEAALYQSRFQETQELAQKYSVTLISGREYSCRSLFHEAEEASLHTLGDSRFLLLDCGITPVDSALLNRMGFLKKKNHALLLAHPERIWPGRARRNIETFSCHFPVAVQLNAGSLLGVYGKREKQEAWTLIEAGLCHVIASDAHHAGGCCLAECREYLSRFFPERMLKRWFEENPERVLADQTPLPVVPLKQGAWKRRIIRFFG